MSDKSLNERLFDDDSARSEIEDFLFEAGVQFQRIGWDEYDNSIELHGVSPDYRLSDDLYKFLRDAGFSTCFVNHTDKWETHYRLQDDSKKNGFRISYPHKRQDSDGSIWVEGKRPDGWPSEFNVTVVEQKKER